MGMQLFVLGITLENEDMNVDMNLVVGFKYFLLSLPTWGNDPI